MLADAQSTEFDLIVVGAGGAGMATALFAALAGLKPLVLERSRWVGGTTAYAAGALWIPNTDLAAGSGDSPDHAARYLEAATRGRSPAALRERFLALGPEAVRQLMRETDVQMRAFTHHPDYLSELPHATLHGRVLECLPFDGRLLGRDFALVRPPIPEFTVLGGMMVDRIDIGHLLNLTRSRASFAHAARLLLRHAMDRLRHPRGTRLVMGNALVARLLHSLQRRDVPVWTQASVDNLWVESGRVMGVHVTRAGRQFSLRARRGVVLAGGGFLDHPRLRSALVPFDAAQSPRARSSPGGLVEQALALGGRLGAKDGSAAFWAPVSVRQRRDGSKAVFPHFVLDRAKPGTLVVDAQGRRFLNESCSYHQFGESMLARGGDGGIAWLIADQGALTRYGLGMVRPGGRGIKSAMKEGYLVRGDSLGELAKHLGMQPEVLQQTVERMNGFVREGIDSQFGRGSTAYQRNLGDATYLPNPTLGPLAQAPYYALRLQVGDIGASTGLLTDPDARVLRGDAPIPGLFAVGNDMQSVMWGTYPGPGINLGPAIVFACAAARAAAA